MIRASDPRHEILLNTWNSSTAWTVATRAQNLLVGDVQSAYYATTGNIIPTRLEAFDTLEAFEGAAAAYRAVLRPLDFVEDLTGSFDRRPLPGRHPALGAADDALTALLSEFVAARGGGMGQ